MLYIKGTMLRESLYVPKLAMNAIGVGAYEGVFIEVEDDKIIITKAKCPKCGADTYIAKNNLIYCNECHNCLSSDFWGLGSVKDYEAE